MNRADRQVIGISIRRDREIEREKTGPEKPLDPKMKREMWRDARHPEKQLDFLVRRLFSPFPVRPSEKSFPLCPSYQRWTCHIWGLTALVNPSQKSVNFLAPFFRARSLSLSWDRPGPPGSLTSASLIHSCHLAPIFPTFIFFSQPVELPSKTRTISIRKEWRRPLFFSYRVPPAIGVPKLFLGGYQKRHITQAFFLRISNRSTWESLRSSDPLFSSSLPLCQRCGSKTRAEFEIPKPTFFQGKFLLPYIFSFL